jgi:hypothetical protein
MPTLDDTQCNSELVISIIKFKINFSIAILSYTVICNNRLMQMCKNNVQHSHSNHHVLMFWLLFGVILKGLGSYYTIVLLI